MKTVAIIQARTGSTRLPGKVLMDLGGVPVLAWVVRACAMAAGIDAVWVATSTLPGDDAIEFYIQVLADKTGSLIATAAVVGVIFSNADESYREPVEQFGERIGVAFQLIDDVIDLSSEFEQTGKTAGTDLRAGVPTLPLLYLRAAAETDAEASDLLARIERDVSGTGDPASDADFAAAVAELREHRVTRDTLAEAKRWSGRAVDALAPLPDGPVKKALTKFAEAIVERTN